ncbi:MAG: glycosyltransferase family 4 protein [Planctomycetes bacterium]|nr:glycosyltransferase family 4 protein [Planctomycetota bacterium]MBI3835757.1 glycosyltransferase family 4 protein [Planctomycetota bacterium]
MPLHVLMDCRMLLGRFSGVARFVMSLANEFARRDDLRVTMLCGNDPAPTGLLNSQISTVTTDFRKADRTPIRRLFWEKLRLPEIVRDINPDVFHATWNHGVPPASIVPSVLTIHDLIPWRERQDTAWEYVAYLVYHRSMRTSFRRAREIVTVSNFVQSDVRAILGGWKAIRTIHNGVGHLKDDSPKSSDQVGRRPFALYVGGHEERKNIAGTFAAMQSYWATYPEPLELWLTGDQDSLSPSAARAFQQIRDRGLIRFLGNSNDEALKQLYESARVLLMLSYDEGFGLPAAEAMAHGCPVIVSNRASLPEIVGDGGILVSPEKPKEVATVMHSLIHDPQQRARAIAHGLQRSKAFSWKDAASAYVEAYHRVAARHGARHENTTQTVANFASRRIHHSAS